MPRRPGIVPALIVLILLVVLLSHAVVQVRGSSETYAAKVNDPRLKAANNFLATNNATGPDFTASPLLYTAFTPVSNSYSVSLVGDRRLELAIGVVLTMAISPLYWYHYYVPSLIPMLWLLSVPSSAKYVAGLAVVALIVISGIFVPLFWWLEWSATLSATTALSWLPLWCAILLKITSPDVDSMTPFAARPTGARRPIRNR